MKVLAIYAVNDHMNQLLLEAQRARMARDVSTRPSLLRRIAGAARNSFARTLPQASASAA